MIFGGGYNKYEGNHFGKVIWARYASTESKIVIMTIMLLK
jgi:iron complex outermembrane receptor protein